MNEEVNKLLHELNPNAIVIDSYVELQKHVKRDLKITTKAALNQYLSGSACAYGITTVYLNTITSRTNCKADRHSIHKGFTDRNIQRFKAIYDITNKQVLAFIFVDMNSIDAKDIYITLVCGSGFAKYLIADTILDAIEEGRTYIFLNSVGGKLGINARIYSGYGFEFLFDSEMINTFTGLFAFTDSDTGKCVPVEIDKGSISSDGNLKDLIPTLLEEHVDRMVPMVLEIGKIDPDCIKGVIKKGSDFDCRNSRTKSDWSNKGRYVPKEDTTYTEYLSSLSPTSKKFFTPRFNKEEHEDIQRTLKKPKYSFKL